MLATRSAARASAPAIVGRDATERAPRHLLLSLTVLALPFSYIPLELVPTKVSVTIAVFALVVVTGIRYGVLRQRPGPLEVATLLLSAYIFVRLTALTALDAAPIDWSEALSATLAPIGGVILFRVARRSDTKIACLRALRWMFLLLTAIAVYQAAAGLAWLRSRGYTEGFYYFTFEGAYRPFGTFLSPTVFGAFLAVVGAALVCMSPTVRGAVLWLVIALVPIALTETRAAWIAFAIALLVGWLLRSRARPVPVTLTVAAAVWSIAFVAWLAPGWIDAAVTRLATITDPGFSSNLARVDLWRGTVEVTLAQSPAIGFRAEEFVAVVGAVAGEYADYGHAHSNYLHILFVYGVLGLVGFTAILLLAIVAVLRAIAAVTNLPWAFGSIAAIIAFVVDSVFETSWISLSVVAVLYLLIGLGQAEASAADSPASPTPEGSAA